MRIFDSLQGLKSASYSNGEIVVLKVSGRGMYFTFDSESNVSNEPGVIRPDSIEENQPGRWVIKQLPRPASE